MAKLVKQDQPSREVKAYAEKISLSRAMPRGWAVLLSRLMGIVEPALAMSFVVPCAVERQTIDRDFKAWFVGKS